MKLIEKLNDIYEEAGKAGGMFAFELRQMSNRHSVRISAINTQYVTSKILDEVLNFLYENYRDAYSIKSLEDERMSDDEGRRHLIINIELKK